MQAFGPKRKSSRHKPTALPILLGVSALLLDIARLGIVGYLTSLPGTGAGWTRCRRQLHAMTHPNPVNLPK